MLGIKWGGVYMKKIFSVLVVIILLSSLGCSDSAIETHSDGNMFIKSVSLSKDEISKNPTVGFLPKIYDYAVNENIKSMRIEVSDYSDKNNPKVVNSHFYELDSLKGRINLLYNPDENELSIELKSDKSIDKISSILDIYDKSDSYAMSFSTKSDIKEGKSIPLIAILYSNSFSEIEGFLDNPKQHAGNYSSAYLISITFSDKNVKEIN